jgi:hypothetical protein
MRDDAGAVSAWVWWGVGAGISLLCVVAAVFLAGMHAALLLGWAVGMVIAAALMLFRGGG